ncbi:MAG TPA: imidazole glycerol phosphate synthase subunit HisF [Kandleria vitulina]|nr:imidazole glycerol phosphate synthase subunit HisF [Kandleria vitulina]
MLAKRIIPCLDIKDGKVVKGVNFVGLKDVGDPVELAKEYDRQSADEVVFLDITATYEDRGIIRDLIERAASELSIPLCVGGGIRTIEDFRMILSSGADKVSVNSAAIKNPQLIKEAADEFGVQCVVVAIDAKKREDDTGYDVYVAGGRVNTGVDLIEWVKKCEELGAGEILLTSMDADGTRDGFDIDMLKAVMNVVSIPVIASGGCGGKEDMAKVFKETNCDAALAASLFHYKEATIDEVKDECEKYGIPVRRNHETGL